jgi:aminopeptidase N
MLFLATSAVTFAQMGRNYHLEDVTWKISFDERTRSIQGDVINKLTPLMDSVSQIALNEGKLDIQKVSVNGQEAKFTIDAPHEQMIVDLPKQSNRGDQLSIEIQYAGKPQAGVYFVKPSRSTRQITTGVVYTQGEAEDTRYWLPTYDEPEDKATSEGYITVPRGYYALSNGSLVDIQHNGDQDVYHWKIDQPHSTYLISFVAAKMASATEKWGDLPVSWYVPEGSGDMGENTFGGTADMVRFYSELTGVKYPYAKFAQAAVPDFPFGGMENISAVTQTIDALNPPGYPFKSQIQGLVLHELAHQWFGDYETCDSWPNNWLNEGFATFLPHFYFRSVYGEDLYQIQKLGDIESALQAMAGRPRPMVEPKYNVPMDLFDGHAYSGGAARLFTLQAILGEKRFWSAIHQFLTEYACKALNTDQFFDCMSKATGQDLSWFDQQFFHTPALPKVIASVHGNTLTLTQGDPVFSLDLDVWELVNGEWKQSTVALNGKTADVALKSAEDPYLIDPQVNWVMSVTYPGKLRPDVIKTLYQHAPNAAQKLRLAEMAQTDGDANLLARLAESETSHSLRLSLIPLISPSQTDALLKFSRDPEPDIRIAAIQQMSTVNNAAYTPRLREIWKTSPSDTERSTAINGLLQTSDGAGYAGKAYHMKSFGDQEQINALNWYRYNKKDKARALALSLLSGKSSENLRVAAISVLGTVKDVPGRKVVFKELVDRLADESLHEKESAIMALRSYHSQEALPYLHKLDDFSMYQIRVEALSVEANLEKKG